MELRKRWLAEHPLCGDRLDGPSAQHSSCVREDRVTAGTTREHIVPLWKGGADDDSNLQTLCESCHAVKTASEAAERASLGLCRTAYPGG